MYVRGERQGSTAWRLGTLVKLRFTGEEELLDDTIHTKLPPLTLCRHALREPLPVPPDPKTPSLPAERSALAFLFPHTKCIRRHAVTMQRRRAPPSQHTYTSPRAGGEARVCPYICTTSGEGRRIVCLWNLMGVLLAYFRASDILLPLRKSSGHTVRIHHGGDPD